MKAVFFSMVLFALLALASVQANRQTLLETELKEADVVTKSGKQIPTSQLFKTGENVDTFPKPSDPRMNLKSPSKWQVMQCQLAHVHTRNSRDSHCPPCCFNPRSHVPSFLQERIVLADFVTKSKI